MKQILKHKIKIVTNAGGKSAPQQPFLISISDLFRYESSWIEKCNRKVNVRCWPACPNCCRHHWYNNFNKIVKF